MFATGSSVKCVNPDVGNQPSFTPTQYDRMIASAKSGIAIDPNAPIEITLSVNEPER